MKKLILTIITTFLPLLASADAVEIKGIFYNLDNEAKTAEVTSKPYGNYYTENIEIPMVVEYEGTTYNVTTIGKEAFYNCRGLTSITIPATVTSIEDGAFVMLGSKLDIYCCATTPPKAAADVFDYSTARGTLHVPVSSVNAYRNAEGWKVFANIMEMGDGVWCPTIIVTTLDGTKVEYLIDKNTKVKIVKPDLVIETDGMVLTYELENMSQVRYGKKHVSTGIPVVGISEDKLFKLENGTLFLSGLSENTLVGIYNVEGKTVMSRRYSGNAQVSLKGLPFGVYLVKFNNETYKILKK